MIIKLSTFILASALLKTGRIWHYLLYFPFADVIVLAFAIAIMGEIIQLVSHYSWPSTLTGQNGFIDLSNFYLNTLENSTV